jgi:hypothetical protein
MPKSRSRSKKPTPENLKHIVELRDKLQNAMSKQEHKEEIGMLCKGMFQCGKQNDDKCLKNIENNLNEKLKEVKKTKKIKSSSVKGGGEQRSRSKKRSKSRNRK